MRKRELQSFTLKLSDLKEYDTIKQEKQAQRAKERGEEGSSASTSQPPIAKVGPKSKQEIRERIGLTET